jgi:hypothetical protein
VNHRADIHLGAGANGPDPVAASWWRRSDIWVAEQFKLYGAIRKCRWAHWWSAFSETVITLIFMLFPIWVPLIAFPMFGNNNLSTTEVLFNQVKNGELYIMAASLLAPLYYFTFPQARGGNGSVRLFPSQQVLVLIFIGTICFAVLAIAAAKLQAAGTGIPRGMIGVSVALFAFCSATFYLSLAVRNSLPDAAAAAWDDQSRKEQGDVPPPEDRPAENASPVDPDALVAETLKAHTIEVPPNDQGQDT